MSGVSILLHFVPIFERCLDNLDLLVPAATECSLYPRPIGQAQQTLHTSSTVTMGNYTQCNSCTYMYIHYSCTLNHTLTMHVYIITLNKRLVVISSGGFMK